MIDRCFGVDVGGTSVKLGLIHTSGRIEDIWEIPTRKENQGAHILDDICVSLTEKIAQKQLTPEDISGIGLGVPGPVLDDGTVDGCVNLGWGRVQAAKDLSRKMKGIPVYAGNDANTAALGEIWQGGGRGFDSMVMVTLGTGVGGGIILHGNILYGNAGSAGEIGHANIVSPEDVNGRCNCGNTGCLEQIASATGIVNYARKCLAASKQTSKLRHLECLTAKDVFDTAKSGDGLALDVVEKVADYLGRALANVASVVDPQIIVVGGGVSKAGAFLTEKIQKYFSIYAFNRQKDISVVLATLGNRAGIIGAAKMVMNACREDI